MEVFVWTAWMAGIAMGMFVTFHFWLMGKPAGCSTGYGNFCGMVTSRIEYFRVGKYAKINNSKLWFLLGIPIGGLLSALSSPEPLMFSFSMGMYDEILPQTVAGKAIWLIFGGILLGFGARLAGACTTGHALVGGAMMNPPSLLAGGIFFLSAFLTTRLLFGT